MQCTDLGTKLLHIYAKDNNIFILAKKKSDQVCTTRKENVFVKIKVFKGYNC